MPEHILPHSHGESMNTEHILHVISQTDNFQTVAAANGKLRPCAFTVWKITMKK